MDERTRFRADVLAVCGAGRQEIEELLRYNENVFEQGQMPAMKFPLPDEEFVGSWQSYVQEVQSAGTARVLEQYLIQMRFPVRAGMSQDPGYLASTRLGAEPPADLATGLGLKAPERCSVVLYPTPAGHIPVITTAEREDFRLLVCALTRSNEPVAIPDSMGACMVAGYRNWDRVRRTCEPYDPATVFAGAGDAQVQKRLKNKASYQDRFVILSNGYYSGVAPEQMGLQPEKWRELSIAIRREHECAHYFTRRVFSSMRNNLIDEIIADYCGIVAACGKFRSDWMLRFFGLEGFPSYRAGGRLENYRGLPPLSSAAFQVLQRLVKQAAENLEAAEREIAASSDMRHPLGAIPPLSLLTLEELASPQALQFLENPCLIATTAAGRQCSVARDREMAQGAQNTGN